VVDCRKQLVCLQYENLLYRLAMFSASFALVSNTLAWSESGHLQIAALAYGELSAKERKDAVLKKHMQDPTWGAEHAVYTSHTPPTIGKCRWVFMRLRDPQCGQTKSVTALLRVDVACWHIRRTAIAS
jgi:hypothetical protein